MRQGQGDFTHIRLRLAIRESGSGVRDSGFGKRDLGNGTQLGGTPERRLRHILGIEHSGETRNPDSGHRPRVRTPESRFPNPESLALGLELFDSRL